MASVYAARIRAARNYAGLTQDQLAEALGVDAQTIKRRESGASAPKKGERLAIAQICSVPPSFMEDGFGEASRDELLVNQDDIRSRLGSIEERLRLIDAAVVGLAGAAVAQAQSTAGQGEGAEGQATRGHPR